MRWSSTRRAGSRVPSSEHGVERAAPALPRSNQASSASHALRSRAARLWRGERESAQPTRLRCQAAESVAQRDLEIRTPRPGHRLRELQPRSDKVQGEAGAERDRFRDASVLAGRTPRPLRAPEGCPPCCDPPFKKMTSQRSKSGILAT